MKRRSFLKASLGLFSLTLINIKNAFAHLSSLEIESLYFPTEERFQKLKKVFNSAVKKVDPIAILHSQNSKDISRVIQETTSPVLMRSGGHSYAGFSTGAGLVVDVRKFKHFEISSDLKTALLGSGLTLSEAQEKLKFYKRTFPSGEYPSVGLGGYFLGGGHSRRSRFMGVGADCVVSMNVILASGERLIDVSPKHHGDLYWALLGGGGGNFAIVEAFKIELTPSFNEYFFKYKFNGSNPVDVFALWEELIQESKSDTAVNLTCYISNGFIHKMIVSGLIKEVSSLEQGRELHEQSLWTRLKDLKPRSFEEKIQNSNRMKTQRKQQISFKGASHYADKPIGREGFATIIKSIKENTKGSHIYMGFYAMGGQILEPKRKLSYPHRDSLYMVDMFSEYRKPETAELYRKNFNELYNGIDHLFSGRSYVNYPNLDFPQTWPNRYYGKSLDKLIDVKLAYDPKNLFDFGEQSLSSHITA